MGILQTWAEKIMEALRKVEADVLPEATINYDYTRLESIAMADHVPVDHLPTLEWWKQLATSIETIVRNTVDADEPPALAHMIAEFEGSLGGPFPRAWDRARDMADLPGVITSILEARGASNERPTSLQDYDKLFQAIQKPAGALRPIEDDKDFARMVVAGPNPMMITRVSEEFVLHQDQNDDGLRSSLQKMAQKNRLYVSDYSSLEQLPASTYPNAKKYIGAPIAYFTIENGSLLPVAITVQRHFVMTFTPDDRDGWKAAKAAVVAADMTMHEVVSHLTMTHLFIEPFVIATERRLPVGHPVYRLLKPHFEGTLFINDLAAKVLVAPGGAVDQIVALTIDATRAVVASALAERPFTAFIPENDFTRRGVEDAASFPDYPYRDDARLLWDTIKRWTTNYVESSYADDAAVASDAAIQAWATEIGSDSGGRVFSFGSTILYRDTLATVLATIIFTASAQHAAVNFPQAEMVDITNFPLAIYASPYIGAADGVLSMLPPLDQALRQVSLGHLLSSVRLAQLGDYEEGWLPSSAADALDIFHADISGAEHIIQERNTTRRPYSYLLPSNIPRSINI